ncbi:phospholipase A2 [Hypoxylon trugodes]|uniref:phospholipase A2 n=1 Tax=Hypoxylon trugodes TaxID=326681 RepID=UPI00219A71E2|nr:phospholipase A2 [Hypoxylon trugodes]KAI1391383.1 phospholipase A2 [Hypoxylon trugodes]
MAQPANPSRSDKWSSLLSRLNPIPGFADYTGPYKVGTVDVEIPVTELDSPAPAPDNAAGIETVQFRIFYPAQPEAQGKRITWLPAPQREHLSAYIQFLGVGQMLAQAVSFLPRHLHYTSIPVIKNAPVLEPNTPNGRWPTAIFSHGLGGSRNAYSQIVGSLASHGVVVICPEHRDGSAVASFIRIPDQQHRFFMRNTRRVVPYHRIAHDPTDEVYALRNDQLRIRLWEMGLIHEAVLNVDKGIKMTNLNKSTPSLAPFVGQLHVHDPGSIIFMGHSFGSATTVQFLKSVFYAGRPELESMSEPLYVPSRDSSIYRQITPQNVTILLDMWCVPLLAKTTKPLWDLPLPVYADDPSSPGGTALLAIESSDFFKWKAHLHETARALSPDPSAKTVQATAFYASGVKLPEPHFFFVERSAHLSQSDFGVLFPWLTRRVFGSEEPERALRLNRRALLQMLRGNGVQVARTWSGDLIDGAFEGKKFGGVRAVGENAGAGEGVRESEGTGNESTMAVVSESESGSEDAKLVVDRGPEDGIYDDRAILDRSGHTTVEAWNWIDIVGMGEVADDEDAARETVAVSDGDETTQAETEAQEPDMAGVIEPHATEDAAAAKVAARTVGVATA